MRCIFKVNIFLFFLIAPFLSLVIVSADFAKSSKLLQFPVTALAEYTEMLSEETEHLSKSVVEIGMIVEMQEEFYDEQYDNLEGLSERSVSNRQLSDDIYEQKILKVLGPAVATHISDRTEIKIFKLTELGYRGYIAKVKLFDPKAMKVVIAEDTLGKLEVTSDAAEREKAILAINGGGFYKEQRNGEVYAQMIGNTVVDGKLVEPFNGYPGDLFFAGINAKGQVIGTVPQTEEQLMVLEPYQGVSFIPVLLENGQRIEIPDKWKKTNQPRTIIGKYANDDLIMIVIDGRQDSWSTGITLERLQEKLLELGVKAAYNLDGGGSSAMYFNGKVLNRPSDGQERPVANNVVILP